VYLPCCSSLPLTQLSLRRLRLPQPLQRRLEQQRVCEKALAVARMADEVVSRNGGARVPEGALERAYAPGRVRSSPPAC